MPYLNPHTFPLVPYPGLAPELATRSGMGGWGAYALAAPNDRLLPFVLSRRLLASNASWVNCAWVEHADTGERLATLVPMGAPVRPAVVPALGLVLTKLVDAANETEYFTYDGALIPGFPLPCGVPLRLIVDNFYQSPRFVALAPAAELRQSHLLLEWYHGGPLQGVPYGRGFRQHFYVDNGSLQELDPREDAVTNKNADTGEENTVSLNQFAQKSFLVEPVPAYLKQALTAARGPRYFLADGDEWKLLSVKSTPTAPDGGRYSVTGTLESKQPLLSRGCTVAPLPVTLYDPLADAARGWRCGDTSDTASDFRSTGVFSCELVDGLNSGYVLETARDINPYSASFNEEQQRKSADQDLGRCPLPFLSREASYSATRNNCQPGYTGTTETLVVPAGRFTSNESQQAADAKAQAFAQANAQTNANTVGQCQVGRSVALSNVRPGGKLVSFDLVRTDTRGALQARVLASVQVDDGTGSASRQIERRLTIADGNTSLLNATIAYGGGVLEAFESLEILEVNPSDYTF